MVAAKIAQVILPQMALVNRTTVLSHQYLRLNGLKLYEAQPQHLYGSDAIGGVVPHYYQKKCLRMEQEQSL